MPLEPKVRKRFQNKVDSIIKKASRLEDETVRSSLTFLKDLRRDIKVSITTAEGWDAVHLPRIKSEINARIKEYQRQLSGYFVVQQDKSWDLGIDFNDEPLQAIGVEVGLPVLSDELLAVANTYTADLITGVSTETIDKISTRLNNAILGKESPWKTMKKIDEEVFRIKDKKGITWRTERIARTEINRVYSISGQARMEQAAEQLPDLKKRWITSLSERVRGIGEKRKTPRRSPISGMIIDHRKAHDQVVKVNEPFIVSGEKLMFPRDPSGSAQNTVSCECVSVPEVE